MAIELKTTDLTGNAVGTFSFDEAACSGGKIRTRLLHSASVMYHNNLRQGSACTKTRAEIAGTTKKLFRQKGTGRARAGTAKSGTRRGGGVIHGPKPRNFVWQMPKKARRVATQSALLGKAKDGELHMVKGLDFETPKTKAMVAFLEAHKLGVETVLIATDGVKRNVYLAGRNVPGVTVKPANEINTRDLLVHKHVLIEESAFAAITKKPTYVKPTRKPKGTRKPNGETTEEAKS